MRFIRRESEKLILFVKFVNAVKSIAHTAGPMLAVCPF